MDLSIGITMILTPIAVLLFFIAAAQPRTSDKYTFRYSKSFFYLGFFADVLSIALLIWSIHSYITEQKGFNALQFWFCVITFSIFICLGLVLVLYQGK